MKKHFLILAYPAQSHINQALHLAHRLAESTLSHVTFSTSVLAHRKMFPHISTPNQEVTINLVTYLPFVDGSDDGFDLETSNVSEYLHKFKTIGSKSISSMLDILKSNGRTVDCVLYTLMLPWMGPMARARGIPSAQYWIHSATVFLIYYHAFLHGFERTIQSKINDRLSPISLPGVPQLRVKDLPSFLIPTSNSEIIAKELCAVFKEGFLALQAEKDATKRKPKVLVNTIEELEPIALASLQDVELIAVGPTLGSDATIKRKMSIDIKLDKEPYVQWLDSRPVRSVVYVSFDSPFKPKKEQVLEIRKGLEGSGRPYLWALKDFCRYENVEIGGRGKNGIIVNCCKQMDVLRHPSVGCFVTQCGWNSTLETLVCGVPVVAVPLWSDQGTNAALMEKVWGNAVRCQTGDNGFVEGDKLRRCLELVLGEGKEGVGVRGKGEKWKKAVEVMLKGGSSDRNLKTFVDGVSKSDHVLTFLSMQL